MVLWNIKSEPQEAGLCAKHRTPADDRTGVHRGIVLGLRQNFPQFMLLVAVNALVGGALGQERTVLPLLADEVFQLDRYTGALAFGLAKAAPTISPAPSPIGTDASPCWSRAG